MQGDTIERGSPIAKSENKNMIYRAVKMAQKAKVFATKVDNLSSVPSTRSRKATILLSCPLTPPMNVVAHA